MAIRSSEARIKAGQSRGLSEGLKFAPAVNMAKATNCDSDCQEQCGSFCSDPSCSGTSYRPTSLRFR